MSEVIHLTLMKSLLTSNFLLLLYGTIQTFPLRINFKTFYWCEVVHIKSENSRWFVMGISLLLSQSSKGEPTSACSCVWLHSHIYQRNTVLEFHKLFKHTSLCVITDITSASTLQVTAATPRGTDCLSEHCIMILMLQLKCRRWCLDALCGWLLYLPFRVWRNVREYDEL